MVIILPKSKTYKMGNDFPLISVPTEGGNIQEATFDDFQWWAYSKDFNAWLKAHPRQWQAESLEIGNYDSIMESIKQNMDSSGFGMFSENENAKERALSFSQFSRLFEEDKEDKGVEGKEEDQIKQAVKFHFAYCKLKSEGKIKDSFTPGDLTESEEQAVFLIAENPETQENVTETLKAFKMKAALNGTDSASKIELVNVSEMLPGGVISDSDAPDSIFKKIIQDGVILATGAATAVGLHAVLKYGFRAIEGYAALKAIRSLGKAVGGKTIKGAGSATRAAQMAAKLKGTKTLWGSIKNLKTWTKDLATVRWVKSMGKAYKVGRTIKNLSTLNSLRYAATFGLKGGSLIAKDFIPFVGQVLMVVDAVGSLWNWYSDNQAPKYDEVKSFAHNELDVKKIPIGIPITFCWCQPAQSTFGAVMSFVSSNDTRTTAELIKLASKDGKSIFLLSQVNSQSIQKQLAEHDLVLVLIDESDIVNDQEGVVATVQRVFDNEDLDCEMMFFDNISDIASILNFQGVCSWGELIEAFKAAPDQLIITDPNAPELFNFYYKDPDDDIINVSGKLVTNEDLRNTNSKKLEGIFFGPEDTQPGSKYTSDEASAKKDEKDEFSKKPESATASESLQNVMRVVNESGVITSFSEFGKSLSRLTEADENNPKDEEGGGKDKGNSGQQKTPVAGQANPNEGPDDPDATIKQLSSPPIEDLCTPVNVMVYYVVEKQYADSSLRKYAMKGSKFTNFLVDGDDIKVRDGESITVEVNTIGGVYPKDPRKGIYDFDKEEEKEVKSHKDSPSPIAKETGDVVPQAADDGGKDVGKQDLDVSDVEKPKENIVVSPKDVKIIDSKKKVVIADRVVKDGVNILDRFLTDADREKLGIEKWKAVSLAKAKMDRSGRVIEVTLKNKFGRMGEKTIKFTPQDGEKFEIAKKFIEETDNRIKYQ